MQLVLERVKEALLDAKELEPYSEKLKGFEPSAHVPDRVSVLKSSDYDTQYRKTKEYLNQRKDFESRDVDEKYWWGTGKIDSEDSDGAIFNLVNKGSGVHIRIILLREPTTPSMLVHELLHIFEEYLNLPFGELARFSQSIEGGDSSRGRKQMVNRHPTRQPAPDA